MFTVRIYNKFMKLIKEIKPTELSETFWREKKRKKDAHLTNAERKNLGERIYLVPTKEYNIKCRECGKKAVRKSAMAKYCSDKCRNKSKKRRDNESKAKRYNARRKGKKGLR